MNKIFKRVMAFLLALTMVLSLAACGAPADETEAPKTDAPADNQTDATAGETEASTEEAFDPRAICEGVTLTIAVPEDDEVSTWDDNLMTKMIYDELGVTLKFQAYPAADFGDKLNVMVNGGDELPDMIWGAATDGLNSYYQQWVAAEVLLPLNEYFENDNYTTYLREACETCGVDLTALMKDANGDIWYTPKYFQFQNGEVRFNLWINEEYASKLGFETIRFFDDGIVDTTILTNDSKAYKAIVTNTDMPNLTDLDYYPQVSGAANRIKYGYIAGLSSEYKEAEAYYSPIKTNCGGVITTDCENPDAAFLVMDFMLSEKMSMMNRYGVEGVNWDYWENLQEELIPAPYTKENLKGKLASEYPEPFVVAYNDVAFWGTGEPRDTSYMQVGPACLSRDIYWGVSNTYDYSTPEQTTITEWSIKYTNSTLDALKMIPDESVVTLPMTTEELADANEIQTTLSSYVRESIGAFLTGEWDIDTYWDTYLAELDKIGIDEVLALYQTAFDRTK